MLEALNEWATGNHAYHTLIDCLGGDKLVAIGAIWLGLMVAAGYFVIACYWFRISREIRDAKAKRALDLLMWIFLFCAACGYLWHPIQYFWPGWRVYLIFLGTLAVLTWGFILSEWRQRSIAIYFKEMIDLRHRLDEIRAEIEEIPHAE